MHRNLQAVFSIAVDNGLIGSGAPCSPRPPSCRTACGGGDVAGIRSRVLPRGRRAAGPLARKKGVPEDHQAARLGGAWTVSIHGGRALASADGGEWRLPGFSVEGAA